MIKILILTSTLLLPSLSSASFFMERDKQKHMAATTIISLGVASLVEDKYIGCAAGLGSALLIGALKELNDPVFDPRDMQANAIGGVTGCVIRFNF